MLLDFDIFFFSFLDLPVRMLTFDFYSIPIGLTYMYEKYYVTYTRRSFKVFKYQS